MDELPPVCLQAHTAGCVLNLRVQPRASRTEINGLHADRLKIRLQAPPVDGQANVALIKFLAKQLQVAPSSLTLLRGETGREKSLLIPLTPRQVADRLRLS